MSSSSAKPGLSVQSSSLLEKMRSTDSDLRTQALIDLHKELLRLTTPVPSSSSSSTSISASSSKRGVESTYTDEVTEAHLVEMVLKLLMDEISEVKNSAVSCIAAMARKSRPPQMYSIVSALLNGIASGEEERTNISCLALKSVVLKMPSDGAQLPQNVETIITKIFALLTKPNVDPQLASELLQILTDIYVRIPYITAASAPLQTSSLNCLIRILSTSRPSIRKRCIAPLSALVFISPKLFDSSLRDRIIEGLENGGDTGRIWVGVVASLARGRSASKIGALIGEGQVIEMIMKQTRDVEDTEAVKGALVALEVLVLGCPNEISPYVPQIIDRALELVKYDPNYVNVDDQDNDMAADEEEDEEYEEEAYSDDEDVSWKIRRAAAKVLLALIGTRNELLNDFYKTAAPILISRFSEREESVRLEVLAAFGTLLKQTITANAAELASGGRNKRKWSEEMDSEGAPDDSPAQFLQAVAPQLLRATLKQLSSKSVPTRQQCFVLLRQTAEALAGGLDSEADRICSAAIGALRSCDSATTSALLMAALSFLAAFFRCHTARCYLGHLVDLVSVIVRSMKHKLQRVNFEAFAAASSLAQSIRPKGSASPLPNSFSRPVGQLFDATTEVLADSSVDSEVRERALETLGSLLAHEGDALTPSYSMCLPLISDRLGNDNTAITAIQVIGKIVESPVCKGQDFDAWLLNVLPNVVVAIRKSKRSAGRSAEFVCLQHMLGRVGSGLPKTVAEAIIVELKPFIETPTALHIVALILAQQPACRSTVEEQLLPLTMEAVKTPSINPNMIDALTAFFAAYIDGDIDAATRLGSSLVDNLGKAESLPDATRGGTSTYTATARCVGVVVEHSQRNAAGVVSMFQKTMKSSKKTEADVYLALLCLGEIGRTVDLSQTAGLSDLVLTFFKNESEEVRTAAAFAAGNLAVGSPSGFLPTIVRHIGSADSESSRLLLLHALKEVILHSSPAQLENLADSLWNPLFSEEVPRANGKTNGKVATSSNTGDDGVRNVKAACIGKLTTTAPAKFLPQLQELLRSSPSNRAIVAAAVRYTFIDTSSAYDDLIAPIIVDFLSLMHDENLIVRRLSLASLNAAIQNKPHLIVDRLTTLQPLLYQETHVKPELQREVQMGPWKVIEDDGLENRKTAYETMYTLLGTCFTKVDLPSFTDRVMAALRDVNEVKVLALMLLLRLAQLSSASVIPRLDEVADALKVIMKDIEVKDDTVKQDLERKEEMQRSTLRTAVPLYKMSTAQQAPGFHAFVGGLLANQQWKDFRDYQA